MLRIIGDVHGKSASLLKIISGADFSICVGDVGFNYNFLRDVSPDTFRFVPGNHDNYDVLPGVAHSLGDYGSFAVPNFGPIFFIRGAWSIDRAYRTPRISWWQEEELTWKQCEDCIEKYRAAKPDFVISHDCPTDIVRLIHPDKPIPTNTSTLLQILWDTHRPKVWVFGHHHVYFKADAQGTKFMCLPELAYEDFTI